jgi:hypothetical protein
MNQKTTRIGTDEYATTLYYETEDGRQREVEFWNVFEQRWERTSRPHNRELATLSAEEREAIIAHLPEYFAREAHIDAVIAGEK